MKLSLENALETGAIKSVSDIKLDNEAKKVLKEGIMLDSSLNVVTKEEKLSISQRVLERENFLN